MSAVDRDHRRRTGGAFAHDAEDVDDDLGAVHVFLADVVGWARAPPNVNCGIDWEREVPRRSHAGRLDHRRGG